ncbi:peptidase M3 [Flavobacterium tibetense]|uniref:Peptidase M3 n=2 Tax=Flavobacterium tibetense TaxID=2233533 RepID=A0A365P263_9FLAO|nr:peptidase M3 [Flavobacterium tibetense]
MNKKNLLILTFASMTMITSTTVAQKKQTNLNPFFEKYNTPYNVPTFDKIKVEHFKPAFLEGIKQQEKEIDAIASNTQKATFENTILAMENSGKLLSEVSTVFFNLSSANTNADIQKIAQEVSPLLAAHSDNINLNEKLFQKVNSLWQSKNQLNLGTEEAKLLENAYKRFTRNGAKLDENAKNRLRQINAELSLLSVNFGQNILVDTNGFEMLIDKKDDLVGLPESIIQATAETAKSKGHDGKWLFTIHNSSVMPFLQYSANRALREKMYKAYKNRGNNGGANDNNENAIKLANLRLEKAQILGYETFAHYALEETMAKTPEKVTSFLEDLWKPSLAKANEEIAEIKTMMNKDGISGDVQPWDYSFYSEKIRKAKFDLDEQELAPYFSIEGVREGIFMVTNKLWGLKFKQITNVPVYHPDVTSWEVMEADGTHLGVLFMDMHPRSSKRGGAWMTSYRPQTMKDGKRVAPVISIVCNFTKPTSTTPALLTFDEVTTFFHEFGHALHGLLSDVKYKSLAGTSVSRDFVELPSQVMENWAADPVVLKMYAKHYKTGAVIPDELIEKLEKAATFGQGFATTEYLASSLLDMDYHSITSPISGKATDYEANSMKKYGLTSAITPRHSSTHFSHVFSGGYSAGYYSYIWSGVLDTDAFDQFKKTYLFSQEKAKSFRNNILSKGGTEDPMVLYKRFRGSEPSIEPLLKKRGLDKKS